MAYIGGIMRNTRSGSSQLNQLPIENALKESTQLMDLKGSPGQSLEAKDQPKTLSMNVAEHLLFLMKEVTKGNVNPASVNAACNCATQMVNLMKVNLKLKDV